MEFGKISLTLPKDEKHTKMKKLIFMLFIGLISTLASCSDEVPTTEAEQPYKIGSRAIVDSNNHTSTTNPDLLTNWENVDYININNANNIINRITPPWKSGSSSALPAWFSHDIKKEDGWTMLFHTFKDEDTDHDLSYMFFYNIFSGIIKVFYYYDGTAIATNSQWVFKCESETPDKSVSLRMFYVPTYLSKADNDPLPYVASGVVKSNTLNLPNSAITKGWNGFEYKVAQYSDENINYPFTIAAMSEIVSSYKFDGALSLGTSGTITSVTIPETTGKNNAEGLINSVAHLGESAANDYISGLISHSQTSGSDSSSNSDFKGKLFGSLLSVVGDLAAGGIGSAIKGALGLLFGQTSTVTVYKTLSDVDLTTEGSVHLDGMSATQQTAGVSPITFNLGEILSVNTESNISNNRNLAYSNSSQINNLSKLGVWCLKKKPIIYFDLLKPFEIIEGANYDSHEPLDVRGRTTYPTVEYSTAENDKFAIQFNPAIEQYITSYSVDKVFFYGHLKEGHYENKQFGANPRPTDLIYWDDSRQLYDFSNIGQTTTFPLLCDMASNEINADSRLWFQWRLPQNSEVLAMITVTMNISYMGKEKTLTESRIFEVDAREKQSYRRHNPPYEVILNYNDAAWMY